MPLLDNLTEADIRGALKASSLRRAQGYVHRVQEPTRTGRTLTAQVRGTRLYEVEIDVEPTGIAARCTCPYNWGGYCKHVGAVLLKWIQSPRTFSVKQPAAASGQDPIPVIPVEPPPSRRPKQPPSWLATPFAGRRQAIKQQLEEWLGAVKLQDLRRMAKRQRWTVKGTRKAAVVQQIMEQIANPGDILRTVLSLDDEHRQVLRALVLLDVGERIEEDDLQRLVKVWGELKQHKQISTYTRHLAEMGLAVSGDVASQYPPRSDFIPLAIGQHIPPVLEGIIPIAADQDVSGDLYLGDPYPFVRTVNQVVALLVEQKTPVPLRSPMPRPRLEKFHAGLKEWDYDPAELLRAKEQGKFSAYSDLTLTVPPPLPSLPEQVIERLAPVAGGERRLEFIFSLLVAAGIFQPGSPVTVWPESREQFLYRDELAQRAILFRTFFHMLNWSALWDLIEFGGALQLKRRYGHYRPESLLSELAAFRHLALRALASLPDGEWVALSDLFRLMRIVWPRFDQSVWSTGYYRRTPKPNWFLVSRQSGKPLRPMDVYDWDLAQGSFIRQIIAGPLHWLGLADLCWSDGKLTAVRFHGLADLYWERVESPPAPRHARAAAAKPAADAVTSDDLTISVVPSAVSAQAHSLLDRIARLDVATVERFVYQLDSQAAHEAFEAGDTLAEILADWDRLLPIPMPEAMRARLTAWWEAYGRVRIYQDLTIIEFGDEYALDEMKAVTSLEKHLIAEISPRLVIIEREAVDSLTADLEKAGYTPKQTDRV